MPGFGKMQGMMEAAGASLAPAELQGLLGGAQPPQQLPPMEVMLEMLKRRGLQQGGAALSPAELGLIQQQLPPL